MIPSFPWIAPPHPPPWRNPRKGRDQILPSGNHEVKAKDEKQRLRVVTLRDPKEASKRGRMRLRLRITSFSLHPDCDYISRCVGRGEHDSQMRRPRGCGHLVNYDARTHLGIPQILHCLMAANLNSFRLCIEAPVHAVRQEWVPKWSANSEVCLSQELSLWCTHTVAVVP